MKKEDLKVGHTYWIKCVDTIHPKNNYEGRVIIKEIGVTDYATEDAVECHLLDDKDGVDFGVFIPSEFICEISVPIDLPPLNLIRLQNHAAQTVAVLEQRLKHRGVTTGKKQWELKLLFSAYEALEVPKTERKFGLDKISTAEEIEPKKWD